jgi:hypothetical protein
MLLLGLLRKIRRCNDKCEKCRFPIYKESPDISGILVVSLYPSFCILMPQNLRCTEVEVCMDGNFCEDFATEITKA